MIKLYCKTCTAHTEHEDANCCNDFGACEDCGRRIHGPKARRHIVFVANDQELTVCIYCMKRNYDSDGYKRDHLAELMPARLFAEIGFAAWLEGVRKEKGFTREQTAVWVTFLLVKQEMSMPGGMLGGLVGPPSRLFVWVRRQQELCLKHQELKAKEDGR